MPADVRHSSDSPFRRARTVPCSSFDDTPKGATTCPLMPVAKSMPALSTTFGPASTSARVSKISAPLRSVAAAGTHTNASCTAVAGSEIAARLAPPAPRATAIVSPCRVTFGCVEMSKTPVPSLKTALFVSLSTVSTTGVAYTIHHSAEASAPAIGAAGATVTPATSSKTHWTASSLSVLPDHVPGRASSSASPPIGSTCAPALTRSSLAASLFERVTSRPPMHGEKTKAPSRTVVFASGPHTFGCRAP